MTEDGEEIPILPLVFDPKSKMFWIHMSHDEDHDCKACECFCISHSDYMTMYEACRGVNHDFLGKRDYD